MTGTAESRNPAAGMDGRESRGRGLGGLGRARLPAPPLTPSPPPPPSQLPQMAVGAI